MFDALINGRIDTRGFDFDVTYADIEELNSRVLDRGCLDAPAVSKISYAVLHEIEDRYILLDSGSALGHGNGPLLVVRPGVEEITSVAIPGVHTTANMLLQRLFSGLTDRRPMLFSEIAPAVARGDFDAGVLIHEGRFTYREHGLGLLADLGVEWGRVTGGLPLPLGAIVASRALPAGVVGDVEELIRRSVEYAFANPGVSREFVKSHAREMDDAVIESHIALFVNENSLALSPAAHRAIRTLIPSITRS
jgi:1,4-dihydroxy-6-naphthoate synthase